VGRGGSPGLRLQRMGDGGMKDRSGKGKKGREGKAEGWRGGAELWELGGIVLGKSYTWEGDEPEERRMLGGWE